jgi:hydrogenase large subunit
MSFQNLPIALDPRGTGTLKGTGTDPYAIQHRARTPRGAGGNGHLRHVDFDPVTRVAGGLALHTVVDLEDRRMVEADCLATVFRGYEIVLQGRDLRDAIFISSRACGACGGVHAPCSALCLEMAFGIHPPPMGIAARNLLLALEFLQDHALHLFTRAGPDFSEPTVRRTSPQLWARAEGTACPSQAIHGLATIAELMTELTRLTGKLYQEALHMARIACEAYALIGGKYPHPQTIVPGGISSMIDTADMNEIHLRIVRWFDYGRKVVAIWNDLVDFFYEADPRYREIGRRPATMIDPGQWDDPFLYDGTFENCDRWGRARWAPPAVIVDGQLVTTSLTALNMGLEEFVDHSFYEDWTASGNGHRSFQTDPVGNPISPYHPWNKQTLPMPGETNLSGKYSWATAARWDRKAMETGPYSRLWATALAQEYSHLYFIQPTGKSVVFNMPKSGMPAAEIEWQVPFDSWGAFERNRARAHAILQSALVAYENALIGLDLTRKGEGQIFMPYKIPKDFRVGVGFSSGGRGFVTHHMTMDQQVIENYQILTPSTLMASPKDPLGNPGPYEEAVIATPLFEDYANPDDYIDVLRTIRSFDPCMSCATH